MGRRNDLSCSHCQPATPQSHARPCPEHHHRTHGSPHSFHFAGNQIDWRILHGVDLDSLVEDASRDDFDALERCLDAGLLDGSLRHEPSTTANNLLHFARLAQFGLQFLWTRLTHEAPLLQEKDNEIQMLKTSLQTEIAAKKAALEELGSGGASHLQQELSAMRRMKQDMDRDLAEANSKLGAANAKVENCTCQPGNGVDNGGIKELTSQEMDALLRTFARKNESLKGHFMEKAELESHVQECLNSTLPGAHAQTISKYKQLLMGVGDTIIDRMAKIKETQEKINKLEADAVIVNGNAEHMKRLLKQTKKDLSKRILQLEGEIVAKNKNIASLEIKALKCWQEGHEYKIPHLEHEVQQLKEDLKTHHSAAEVHRLREKLDLMTASEVRWKQDCLANEKEVGRLTSKLDRWENHVCRPITPDPKHCSACPDKQRQLDSQQSRFRQLESDHASELRKLERQVQDLQAQLQSFSGLQQILESVEHARQDISSYNDQVTKMAHAKQDIEDVSYKLKALMRFSR